MDETRRSDHADVSTGNAANIRAWSTVSQEELDAFGDEGDFARQHLLTPALLDFLGPVAGRAVLDAGAGNGYLSRKLARMGAAVTALEPSDGPYEYITTREADEPLGITCIKQDLSTLRGFESRFDTVVANMVLLDIADYQPAIANCLAALKLDGRFIFSLEHPFTDVADRTALPIKLHDYFSERQLPRAHGYNFHRTLQTYVDAVADCGGLVVRIKEPRLARGIAQRHPERAWSGSVPAFILIKAMKPDSASVT